MVEMVITDRIAATQILYGSLGWQIANRLPGYFGNMFISPQEVATTLTRVEAVLSEINAEAFLERACAISGIGVGNDRQANRLLSLLPSALGFVLKQGHGLVAISHPHLGSLPFFENHEDAY